MRKTLAVHRPKTAVSLNTFVSVNSTLDSDTIK
jgi:hypothetical protein